MIPSSPVPIILPFYGYEPYVTFAIRQVLKSNPNSEVILMTTKSSEAKVPKSLKQRITIEFLEDHFDRAREFRKLYEHFNSNPYVFELFAIQRWFAIESLMNRRAFSSAVMIDGDVLVYVNLSQEAERFKQTGLAWQYPGNPPVTFFNSLEALQDMLAYFEESYRDPERKNNLKSYFEDRRSQGLKGGAGEMVIMRNFEKEHPDLVTDINFDVTQGFYDRNISAPEGFKSESGLKKITFDSGLPFAERLDPMGMIRMNTLHCQGKAKGAMAVFARKKPIRSPYYVFSVPFMVAARWAAVKRRVLKPSVLPIE